jgi:hypothetical protein
MLVPNSITPIRSDLAVLRAVLDAGVGVTDSVINGAWRWFQDVELPLPLPVMTLSVQEQRHLAKTVLSEMDALFASLEKQCEGKSLKQQAAIAQTGEAERVNALWRELAGCYAELINDEVPQLPESARVRIQEAMIGELAERFEIGEDEARLKVRTDTTLRMMLRMSGLNPDEII